MHFVTIGPQKKLIDDKNTKKASLRTRGFEEEQHFHMDSPTCCKEGLHVTCCMIASKKWLLKS